MDTKEKIKNFPNFPGVYLMKDEAGCILYVGKASSLRRRVSSYFQKPPTDKTQALLERTADIDYIQTGSSAAALLLENALIKRYRPHYNAALKDGKSYPFVKISMQDDYPYLLITRGKKEKNAHYYGPYTNVKLLKSAIKTIRAIFPFRSCRKLPKKPCLYFHLKLCPGMCVKKVDKHLYRENLRQLELFLEGRHNELFKQLKIKMFQAAKDQFYEEAARFRDRVSSLTEIIAQTKETKRPLAFARDDFPSLSLGMVRGMVSLSNQKNGKYVESPLAFARDDSKNGKCVESEDLILELQKTLGLAKVPRRIEAFDISEIGGQGLSGSMVSFLDGWPDKKNYRKFRIKTVRGIDDYAMTCEVLRRRYSKAGEKDAPPLPDLVMIDGGKGHLSCARAQLKNLGLAKLPVIALAKRLENIYTSKSEVICLPKDSKLLHLLQRIRDEAHRFAISYHRKLRRKGIRLSLLDEIAGIGPKRKQLLLRYFKSIDAIKKASLQDLLKLERIDKRTAKNIVKHFR